MRYTEREHAALHELLCIEEHIAVVCQKKGEVSAVAGMPL